MSKAISAGERRAIRTAAALYGAVWLACLALYWVSLATGGLGGGAIMGYTLLVLYVVLPVAGAVASFLVGRARGLGGWRLLSPLASAALYLVFTGVTFGLSTALGLTNIAPTGASMVALACACALLGLVIGMALDVRARTRR